MYVKVLGIEFTTTEYGLAATVGMWFTLYWAFRPGALCFLNIGKLGIETYRTPIRLPWSRPPVRCPSWPARAFTVEWEW